MKMDNNEDASISNLVPQNNDSTINVECEAHLVEHVIANNEEPMIGMSQEKDDTMKKDVKVEDIKENLMEVVLKSKKRKRKKKVKKNKIISGGSNGEVAKIEKVPMPSENTAHKKVEGSGMIFMCSSKTKKDCFKYKVLGLSASKKDLVSKIYKGMRLFLFDFDLKLMYGVYKAISPGGYNIEPKAFNSAYPSQVRFTVLEDHLPLAEEKFKKVIQDNYYTKSKFNCQLTTEQVNKLCKLFRAASNGPKPRGTRADNRRTVKYLQSERFPIRSSNARTQTLEDLDGIRAWGWEDERQQLYHEEPALYGRRAAYPSPRVPLPRLPEPVMYEREAFTSPVVSLPRLPPPVYSHERLPVGIGLYGLDRRPLLEHHESRIIDDERRVRGEIEHHDPYSLYREELPPLYRDRAYPVGLPVEYRRPRSPSPELLPPRSSYGYRY